MISFSWNLLQIILASFLALMAINFGIIGLKLLFNPKYAARNDRRQDVAKKIAKYNKGELTLEQLKASCPKDSLHVGTGYTNSAGVKKILALVSQSKDW